jgi:methylated-DNA-[protein]-cysteine S-methyltransferase
MEIVHTARFDTPFGEMLAASTERGFAYLQLPRASGRGLNGWLRRFAPQASLEEAYAPNRSAIGQILEYLEGKRERFDLSLDLRGTEFALSVYREVARIPYGETATYSEVARVLGHPRAFRAVGNANAGNPLSLVIPCHRVVAAGGRLGGYGGGLAMKRQLLVMERERPAAGDLL